MTVPDDLYWNEPDVGCVACGEPVLTVDDHRCGSCLGQPVGFCPLCLGAIGGIVEREVARRWRAASGDVSEAWTVGSYLKRIDAAVTAVAARAPEAAERRAASLREKLAEAPTVTLVTAVTHPQGGGEG
jgi:hypothetical protein